MAKFYDKLEDKLTAFIERQKLFFVATAPLGKNGRINLSPKGMDSLRVLSENRIAFLNLTGSGNETAAHLLENGRLTIMFCSFEADPMILRTYGHGTAVHRHDDSWNDLYTFFPPDVGARQVIVQEIEMVQTSCGFAVPFYEYAGEREALRRWGEAKGEEGLQEYWQEKNVRSLDGLPTGLFG